MYVHATRVFKAEIETGKYEEWMHNIVEICAPPVTRVPWRTCYNEREQKFQRILRKSPFLGGNALLLQFALLLLHKLNTT